MKPDFSTLNRDNIVAFIGDIFDPPRWRGISGRARHHGRAHAARRHDCRTERPARRNHRRRACCTTSAISPRNSAPYHPDDTEDRHHEDAGAEVLEQFFPSVITDCCRYHVAAKRYLCATKPEYFNRLSAASVHTLELQGGPMSARRKSPNSRQPEPERDHQVRYLDEAGKRPDMETPDFHPFRADGAAHGRQTCGHAMSAPEYIFEASTKPSLPWHEVPLIRATDTSVKGYGCLVDDPESFEIEIVRWPQQGWRPIDEAPATKAAGSRARSTATGRATCCMAENEAVNGHYVLGWSAPTRNRRRLKPQTAPRGSGAAVAHELSPGRRADVLAAG